MPTTVILGGGIIALSTAYYASLSSPTSRIYIIESSPTLFTSASGKAAGFISRDWYTPPVTDLGELSFALHKELAQEHDGHRRWGYSGSTGISISARGGGAGRGQDWLLEGTSRAGAASSVSGDPGSLPRWLESGEQQVEVISGPGTTAQVDPEGLCRFLLEGCLSRGVEMRYPARATRVEVEDGSVVGVHVVDSVSGSLELIQCERILIACGVWSSAVFDELFPEAVTKLPVSSLAGHSVVLHSPRWKPEETESEECHAVFAVSPDGWSPEIFSRRGGDIYIAGLNSRTIPIPRSAAEAVIQEEDIKSMIKTARQLLGEDMEVVKSSLCFRPITSSGTPIVGKIPSSVIGLKDTGGGVYVATGHGPWGVSLSLGTGKVMAEMMNGDKTSADVGQLGL